ncbi:hypothetical protein DSAG12_01996 [Promethearchaeum syntrophicum]|uniref:Uncharacterized protein n=1 Tax=Promethearchaeum syntrophicum TaxID=2594042 RepID=A0A5B9DBE5_9ARCH|nr:hypothetical protein [Candidatus Prometheoarchaeum syntrophicum]QEE16167.1 hypothetical protein DSAG12_01996 [Candidatus Prometheoarchaeum syntrophicum]
MDEKRIDEIGEKLNVNSSEIKKRKSPNWFKKHSFWIINITNFVLSSLLGIIFGLFEQSYQSFYPFQTKNAKMGLLGVSSVNLTNGILTILQKSNSISKKIQRILIFSMNLILSLIGYWVFYSLSASSSGLLGMAMDYDVYDSSKQKV